MPVISSPFGSFASLRASIFMRAHSLPMPASSEVTPTACTSLHSLLPCDAEAITRPAGLEKRTATTTGSPA